MTPQEAIEKYGPELWDRMCKTGYLDGITCTIKRALCEYKCRECGYTTQVMKDGKDLYTKEDCPACYSSGTMGFIKFLDAISDIPERDISIALRAAQGEQIGEWEWD